MSKILVVDDSYAELQMIEAYLKGASHTVVSFPNSEKLEDKVIAEKPDLIVMDVVMPSLSGPDAYSKISALRPGIEVIFTTGYTSEAASLISLVETGRSGFSVRYRRTRSE